MHSPLKERLKNRHNLTETESDFTTEKTGGVKQTGKTNDGAGTVLFDKITYTEEGTHYYIIEEVAGTDSTITYDTTPKHVTVTVTKSSNSLVAVADPMLGRLKAGGEGDS